MSSCRLRGQSQCLGFRGVGFFFFSFFFLYLFFPLWYFAKLKKNQMLQRLNSFFYYLFFLVLMFLSGGNANFWNWLRPSFVWQTVSWGMGPWRGPLFELIANTKSFKPPSNCLRSNRWKCSNQLFIELYEGTTILGAGVGTCNYFMIIIVILLSLLPPQLHHRHSNTLISSPFHLHHTSTYAALAAIIIW